MLVSRFFRVYSLWRWPNPVMLCDLEENELGFYVWDWRKNPSDRTHHMPIITPAYPCTNSSKNVSQSTLCVMEEQFRHGNKICEEVEVYKTKWCALFEPYLFFASYKNYLQIEAVAADADDLRSWRGWVESKLKKLTRIIERDTLGLHRKPGDKIQGHEQFDIRGSVDEFKLFVNMYMFWKPEMEIYVSHVHKRLLPAYVFPDGYR
ncbi:hypothetical protein ACFX11_046602 [Malus domestica]